jgi:hypothetical protein
VTKENDYISPLSKNSRRTDHHFIERAEERMKTDPDYDPDFDPLTGEL